MAKFLIDVNLPYYFSFWNSADFEHLWDINDEMKDEEVWEYAKTNNLTIISKDSDFSNRIIVSNPPPKVIHIKIGNVTLKELYRIC
jgi:predicted nuclease of predicted toxin-antitoxin system